MWAQILLWAICISAAVWGVMRLIYEREPFAGILVNVFWWSLSRRDTLVDILLQHSRGSTRETGETAR
jgi:hypothetical protein